jgi:hypothetical protein
MRCFGAKNVSRRRGEITGRMNERDFPHIIELPLASGGSIQAFHLALSIQSACMAAGGLGGSLYWGRCFKITQDQATKAHFDTSAGGSRISTSVRGSLLGIGGDLILIDDPHTAHGAESEADRLEALTWWHEISTTRLNDPKRSAIVVIMQRLHEEDVSGGILSSEWSSEWTHLKPFAAHCTDGMPVPAPPARSPRKAGYRSLPSSHGFSRSWMLLA